MINSNVQHNGDSLKHYCGIVGLISRNEINIPEKLFYPLFSLQHRGQEGCGITYSKKDKLVTYKDLGMIGKTLSHYLKENHPSNSGIAHVRYSTSGGNRIENVQPFSISCNKGDIAIVHNGTISNSHDIRKKLFAKGSIFQSSSDTELILHMISSSRNTNFIDSLFETLKKLKGAFSLLVLYKNKIIAIRDPSGFRPLVMGMGKDFVAFASETCALDILQIKKYREIKPGEMLTVNSSLKIKSQFFAESKRKCSCIFELIYFARPDSSVFNYSVHKARERMGEFLARIDHVQPDIVIPVPDSGNSAALGYSQYSKVAFEMGLTRNHYTGRSFIQPTKEMREFGVRMKLHPIKEVIRNKIIVLVDDSLVRGTTSKIIVKLLKEAGAKEIHLRLSSPPITHPCFFGIDIPTTDELISHHMSALEIAKHINADSVLFLPVECLEQCVQNPKDFCYACFTGKYPIKIDRKLLEGNQICK